MKHTFPTLLSPLQVGGRTVRNRIALSATLTNFGAGHTVTDRWINFIAERAKGGAGMIITELIAVDQAALAHHAIVTGYDTKNEDGFKRSAEIVESAGARLIGQLWHPGRQQLWNPVISPKGISDQPDAYSWTVPHVMSTDELRQVADAYVEVAKRLQRSGFSGVELHGAHGYLITQILSPWSNTRKDSYGGSTENRVRFVQEVATAIRQSCGSDFIVGLKMPADEGVGPQGIDPEEAKAITRLLQSTVDYFAYSQGNFSLSLENHVPDMHFRRGHFLDLHKRLRPIAAGTPVMAIGRIATPQEAEDALVNGHADLVGLTRALIADADWPAKARDGRPADIRPSTYDNFSWGEVHAGKPIAEVHNPELGTKGESGWKVSPSPLRRRVVVVGAGPAGLQAARIAAERGHDVTLIGVSNGVGGKLAWEARLPGREEYANLIAWMERKTKEAGVKLALGRRVSAAQVIAMQPDFVVVATGSHQRRPDGFEGGGLSAHDWSDGSDTATAVLFDMDHTAATYAVADAMSNRHTRLVLLTPRTQLARNVNYCSAIGVHRRLFRANVEILLGTEPIRLINGLLTWRNVFSGRTGEVEDVGLFVWSTPRIAEDSIVAELRQAGLDTRLVGDCMAPRNLFCAIHEGEAVASAL